MEFKLTMVLMPSGVVMRATARIIGTGPTARTKSILRPDSISSFELLGNQPLLAVTAVVGHHIGLAAGLANLLLEDDHLGGARSFNKDDVIAGGLERVGRGQRHRRADAACQHHHRPEVLNLRRLAEWADNVQDRVAGLQAIEQGGGFADGLHDDGNRAHRGVRGFDGERNALAFFMQPKDDELPRLVLARNARRLNHKLLDVEADGAGIDNSVHGI